MSHKKLLLTLLSIVFFVVAAFGLSACFFIEPDFYCDVDKTYESAGVVMFDARFGFAYGKKITLSQTTNLGYTFRGWYKNGKLLSEKSEYSFVVREEDTTTDESGCKHYSLWANWEKNSEIAAYEFTSTPTECEITGLKDKSVTLLTFPDYVTEIGRNAFKDESGIKGVQLNGTIKRIGSYAFSGSSIGSVNLTEGLEIIEPAAFKNCKNLDSIAIPSSVKEIQSEAFGNCPVLEEVRLSEGIEKIERYTFECCGALEKISFPSGLKTIESSAFNDCEKLSEVYLPDSLTEIGDYAFINSAITEIVIPLKLENIGIVAFGSLVEKFYVNPFNTHFKSAAGNSFLLTADGKTLLCGGRNGNIPEGVEKIEDFAFWRREAINGVVFSSSVQEIGAFAFSECSNLRNVSLNEGLEIIEDEAFFLCEELINLNIPQTVRFLGSSVFYHCDKLKGNVRGGALYLGNSSNPYKVLLKVADGSITECVVENGTGFIADNAFYGCKYLESVTLPDGLRGIQYSAFAHCSKLRFVNIPDSVENIGDWAFNGCPAVEGNEYGNAVYLGNESNNYIFLVRPINENITSCEINPCVKFINENVFSGCKKLENVTLPEGLTHIANGMFCECTALREISLPSSIKIIEDFAFCSCTSLESITFNGTVEELGDYCFANSAIKTLIIPAGVKRAEQSAFNGCSDLKRIYYCGSYEEGRQFFHYGKLNCYFYTEENPRYGQSGGAFNGWHYVNGEIVEWD